MRRSKRAIAIVASDERRAQLGVCIEAIRKFNYEIDICVLYYGDERHLVYSPLNIEVFSPGPRQEGKTLIEEIIEVRPTFARRLLFLGGYQQVLQIGADVIFYHDPAEIFESYKQYDAAGTPHILSPIEEDGRVPHNRQVHLTGQLNSDVALWNNSPSTIKFLEWQYAELKKANIIDIQNGYFFDQVYLSFAPYFINNFHIIKDQDHNIAYYNLHERDLNHIKTFQFTGYQENTPSYLSKYMQRLENMTLPVYRLIEDYQNRLDDWRKRNA